MKRWEREWNESHVRDKVPVLPCYVIRPTTWKSRKFLKHIRSWSCISQFAQVKQQWTLSPDQARLFLFECWACNLGPWACWVSAVLLSYIRIPQPTPTPPYPHQTILHCVVGAQLGEVTLTILIVNILKWKIICVGIGTKYSNIG